MAVAKTNLVPVRRLTLNRLAKRLEVEAPRLLEEFSGESRAHSLIVVSPDDLVRKVWERLLSKLEEATRLYAEIVRRVAEARRLSVDEVLRVYADLLAYMLRWPLYLSPRPDLGVVAPHVAIPVYLLLELLCPGARIPFYRVYGVASSLAAPGASGAEADIEALAERCGVGSDLLVAVLSRASGLLRICVEELPPLLELLVYTVPSDTRPGLNSSSLLLHDLLASSIAVARLVERGYGPTTRLASIARIAALLHDIGKPLDYENHVKASVERARRLLGILAEGLDGVVPGDELRGVVERVVSLVEHHHSLEKCRELGGEWSAACEAIVEGDRLASQMDRLAELIVSCAEGRVECGEARAALERIGRVLSEALGVSDWREAIRVAYMPGRAERRSVWRAWRRVYERLVSDRGLVDAVRVLSEWIVGRIAGWGALVYQPRLLKIRDDLGVLIVDIGGVQRLIRGTSKLRTLASMSLAVDYMTMVGVPLALRELGVPLEAIVFAGGATVQALVAARLSDRLVDELERVVWSVLGGRAARVMLEGVELRVEFEKLAEDGDVGIALYGYTVRRAHRKLARRKLGAVEASPQAPRLTLYTRLCAYCGAEPAVTLVAGEPIGLRCYARYHAFPGLGFRARSVRAREKLRVDVGEEPTGALTAPRGSKLAVLKTDGNVMSVFMASSLTPAAFFEKSVRIDLALKKGVQRLYELVYRLVGEARGVNREYLAAILVHSYMYSGGDDALLILPSEAALPAALLIAYTFAAETGFRATLSAGVAAGPREQPVWWLLEAAEELLEEAKSVARSDAMRVVERYPVEPSKTGGSILYDYAASGALTRLRVEARLAERRLAKTVATILGENSLPVLAALAAGLHVEESGATGIGHWGRVLGEPGSVEEDESNERLLEALLERVLLGTVDAGLARGVERLASSLPRLELLPAALVERAADPAYRALLGLIAGLVEREGRLDAGIVKQILTELYIVSRLIAG